MAYSPDLNIIENVWKFVKHYVREKRPTTAQAMIDFAFEAWNSQELTVICGALYDTFINRVQEAVEMVGS